MNKSSLLIKNINRLRCFRSSLSVYSNRALRTRCYARSGIARNHLAHQLAIVRCIHSATAASTCWNCKRDNSILNLTCDYCHVIQHPRSKSNYFTIFDLNQDFNLDQKLLTRKYRQFQAVLHPDKFANKSDQEKEISAEFSSLVNKAYSTLQNPISRALHMLKLHDVAIDEDVRASDPEFLMEIMEINEEVEEANTPDKLRALNVKNNRVLEECGKEVSKHFKDNKIDFAKNSVIKMKYYVSIKSHIDKLMRDRGIVD